jgi:hypothetical protein
VLAFANVFTAPFADAAPLKPGQFFPSIKKMLRRLPGAARPSGRHGRTFTPAGADLDNIGAGPMRICCVGHWRGTQGQKMVVIHSTPQNREASKPLIYLMLRVATCGDLSHSGDS